MVPLVVKHHLLCQCLIFSSFASRTCKFEIIYIIRFILLLKYIIILHVSFFIKIIGVVLIVYKLVPFHMAVLMEIIPLPIYLSEFPLHHISVRIVVILLSPILFPFSIFLLFIPAFLPKRRHNRQLPAAACMPACEPEVQGGRLPCPVSRCFREDHLVYRREGAHDFHHGRIPDGRYAENDLQEMFVKVWRQAHIFLRNRRECNRIRFQDDRRRLITSASVCLSYI